MASYTFTEAWDNRTLRYTENLYVTFSGCMDFGGPREVVFWYKDKVAVAGSYADDHIWERAMPYDDEGNTLIYIPSAEVKLVLDEEEANQLMACHDADMQLLSYAR